jgi:hypothetical protein
MGQRFIHALFCYFYKHWQETKCETERSLENSKIMMQSAIVTLKWDARGQTRAQTRLHSRERVATFEQRLWQHNEKIRTIVCLGKWMLY